MESCCQEGSLVAGVCPVAASLALARAQQVLQGYVLIEVFVPPYAYVLALVLQHQLITSRNKTWHDQTISACLAISRVQEKRALTLAGFSRRLISSMVASFVTVTSPGDTTSSCGRNQRFSSNIPRGGEACVWFWFSYRIV